MTKSYEIKKNKSNGQKFIYVDVSDPLEEGEFVELKPVKNKTEDEIKFWCEQSDGKISEINKTFHDMVEAFFKSAKYLGIEKIRNALGIEIIDLEYSYEELRLKGSDNKFTYEYGGNVFSTDDVFPNTQGVAYFVEEFWSILINRDIDMLITNSKELATIKIYSDYREKVFEDFILDLRRMFNTKLKPEDYTIENGSNRLSYKVDGINISLSFEFSEESSNLCWEFRDHKYNTVEKRESYEMWGGKEE